MPTLILPPGNDAVAGAVSDANKHTENLWHPEDPDDSFAIVEGGLDRDNLKTGVKLTRDEIQPGEHAQARMTGCTANLDYFPQSFQTEEAVSLETGNDPSDVYHAVPGLGIEFFLPFDVKFVLLSWVVQWGCDNWNEAATEMSSQLLLFVDNVRVDVAKRGVYISTDVNTSDYKTRIASRSDRVWSGHHTMTNVDAGWHSVGLRVIMNGKQTRIRVRNIKAICFR